MHWDNSGDAEHEHGALQRAKYVLSTFLSMLTHTLTQAEGQLGKCSWVSSVNIQWYQLRIHSLVYAESGNLCGTIIPIIKTTLFPNCTRGLQSLKLQAEHLRTHFLSSLLCLPPPRRVLP